MKSVESSFHVESTDVKDCVTKDLVDPALPKLLLNAVVERQQVRLSVVLDLFCATLYVTRKWTVEDTHVQLSVVPPTKQRKTSTTCTNAQISAEENCPVVINAHIIVTEAPVPPVSMSFWSLSDVLVVQLRPFLLFPVEQNHQYVINHAQNVPVVIWTDTLTHVILVPVHCVFIQLTECVSEATKCCTMSLVTRLMSHVTRHVTSSFPVEHTNAQNPVMLDLVSETLRNVLKRVVENCATRYFLSVAIVVRKCAIPKELVESILPAWSL